MPMYEYVCRECETTFEELVFPGDAVKCPSCRGEKLERLLSVPARPKTDTPTPLPTTCNSVGPPCGPTCRRWPG